MYFIKCNDYLYIMYFDEKMCNRKVYLGLNLKYKFFYIFV